MSPVLQLLALVGMLCVGSGIVFVVLIWLAFKGGLIEKDPF